MKKTVKYVLAAVTVIAAVSCGKEKSVSGDNPATEIALVPMTFTATNDSTKSFINEGSAVHWQEGDNIAVFDNISTAPHEFEISDIEGPSARFSGEVSQGATEYYVVYPYSAAVSCDFENGTLTATLPENQVLGGQNCSQGALVAVGKADPDGTVKFQNVFSRVRVQVTYSDISEIIVAGSNLSGTASFNVADGSISSVSDGKSTVRLLPAAESSVIPTGTYYIALLPGTTPAGGFSLTMKRPVPGSGTDGFGYCAMQTAEGAVTLKQKGGVKFDDMDTRVSWDIHLSTKGEMLAWNAAGNWKANDNVYLDADIDLENAAWTVRALPGKFYGQNHSITNITIDTEGQYAGFFGSVTGSVGNVTFGSASDDSSIRTTNASGTTYVGSIAQLDGGSAENVTSYMDINYEATSTGTPYVGGVVGSLSTTSGLSSCSNYGNITITPAVGVAINIGGVAASAGKECTLSDCSNAGTIDFASPSFTASVNFGGVLGYTDQKITLSGCTNTGTLKLTNDNGAATTEGQVSLGGILGYSNNSANQNVCVVDGCTNGGAIVRTGASATNTYLGGIVGYSNYSITIKDCTNAAAGAISSTKKSGSYLCQGGMIGSLNAAAATLTVTDCANYGELNASNSTGNYLCQGGIVGYLNSGCSISGSDNSGAITRASGCTGKYEYVGGIIGTIPQNVTATISASGCTNHGTLTVTGKNSISGSDRDGGIVGSVASKATYTDCDNFGTLLNNSGSSALRIGGIVGSTSAAVSNYTDCDNHGEIKCTKATTSADIGGLCGYNSQACSFTTCINCGKVTGATTVTENVGGIFGNNTKAAKLISCSSRADITTAAADNKKAGAMVGSSTVSCTVKTCSVGALKVGAVTLDANNYGSYLKGAATTAETNLTVANVIFLGEESSQSGSTETIGDLSDVTLE